MYPISGGLGTRNAARDLPYLWTNSRLRPETGEHDTSERLRATRLNQYEPAIIPIGDVGLGITYSAINAASHRAHIHEVRHET